jgi:hypothetical protein
MSCAADFGLSLAKKHCRHTGSAGRSVDVDLLDLVALHDDESHDLAVGLGHPHTFESFASSGYELLLVAIADELRRNVPEVTVSPTCMPDPGNGIDISGIGLADEVPFGRCSLA